MVKNHKMKDQGRDQGMTYLDRMAAMAEKQPENRIAAEAARLRAAAAACSIPDRCGPDIAPSPARGGFVLARQVELLPVGSDKVEAVHRGYGGRSAIRAADVFDAMLAAAARAKRPAPLTPGQIAIGRRYGYLVELLAADGTKLSSLEASFGSGAGRDWMDLRMEYTAELERMRLRLGDEPAMVLRRIRPSQRGRVLAPGERAPYIFTRRELIDGICLKGYSIKQVLALFSWQDNGRNAKAALEALSGALDAMIGYRSQKTS